MKIEDDVEDTKAVLNNIRNAQVSHELRSWSGLKAPDVSVNYNEACKKRHSGTGHWFVKGTDFNTWLSTPNSFLWLNGFAGCGKSLLSSTAIQLAERHRQQQSRPGKVTSGLAYFYFTFNDESKQDATVMLRSPILQLAGQIKTGEEHLKRLEDSFVDATPPDDELLGTLNAIIRKFEDVYIIVDALDESPKDRHRDDLLDAVQVI